MSSFNIEYTEKIIPDAYHGTSRSNAAEIQRSGFNPSVGDDQYFGDGVYFFESSKWNAEYWSKRKFGPEGVVIRAIINLARCLDLHDHECRIFLRRSANKLQRQIEERARRSGRGGIKRVTDALAINFVATLCNIDTVRGSYVQPDQGKAFEGSRVMYYHQIMICVRNTAMIQNWHVM